DKQDFIKIVRTDYEVLYTISDTDINQHILSNTSQKKSKKIGKLFAKKNVSILPTRQNEFDKYLKFSEL
ncbi:14622_t:CDS:1, partial [Cetraspora pellucida]